MKYFFCEKKVVSVSLVLAIMRFPDKCSIDTSDCIIFVQIKTENRDTLDTVNENYRVY